MAVSETSICNMALTRIGHDFISSLTESTKAGRLCNLHYEPTRDALLRSHPWNFAVRRAELSQIANVPTYEFGYAYALPTDFLRMVRTQSEAEGDNFEYRIEGQLGSSSKVLVTDEGTMKIEYIAKITDPTAFDAAFVDVLAQRLAAEIAVPLTDNANMAANHWRIYQDKLREARNMDAQEGTPRGIDADYWIGSRY